jgi:hypothetical protein
MSSTRFLRTFLPTMSPTLTLAVEAGQVVCPRRGILDTEHCFACRDFRGALPDDPDTVVCKPRLLPGLATAAAGYAPR